MIFQYFQKRPRVFLFSTLALILVSLTIAILRLRPVITGEAQGYLLNYCLHGKTFLEYIFDPNRSLEWTTNYQAREFDYPFDLLDARIIAFFIKHGFVVFPSVVHYFLAAAVACTTLILFFSRISERERWLIFMVVFLYITSPSIWFMNYFRTGKALCGAFLAFLALLYIWKLEGGTNRKKLGWGVLTLIFFCSLFMTAADHQGYLMGLGAMGTLFVLGCLDASKRIAYFKLAAVQASAALLFSWYNFKFGPILIKKFAHSTVDFSFQTVNLSEINFTSIRYGWALFEDQISFFFGNLSLGRGILALVFAVLLFEWKLDRFSLKTPAAKQICVFVSGVALIVFMFAVMSIRHPPILEPEIRLIYYWLPVTSVIFLYTCQFTLRFVRRYPRARAWCTSLLGIILLSNVIALHSHTHLLVNGCFSDFFPETTLLRRCISSPTEPLSNFRFKMTSSETACNFFRSEARP